jgi:hypothetical protein
VFENIESVIEGAKARAEHLRRIVNEVFKSGVHYGSATGGRGGKPTLLKPGVADCFLECAICCCKCNIT